jgi:hypothetical protein
MDAVLKTKIAASLALCLLVTGCGTARNRQVTTRVFMDRNTVTGKARHRIWESAGSMRGCDVTVTYRGTPGSPARLLTNKTLDTGGGGGPEAQSTDWSKADDVTVRLRGVQELWMDANSKAPEFSYVIERVISSRGARVLDTSTLPSETLASAVVPCGAVEQTVWKSLVPGYAKSRGCNVTVRLRSVDHSRPVLHYTEANGHRCDLMVDERGELVTLKNVVNISASCAGGGGRCSIEIMQTDCPQ